MPRSLAGAAEIALRVLGPAEALSAERSVKPGATAVGMLSLRDHPDRRSGSHRQTGDVKAGAMCAKAREAPSSAREAEY